jgi:hypothetical protein
VVTRSHNSSATGASRNSGDGDRYVQTADIVKAVAGHEAEVLKAIGIDWPGGSKHITCPYPDHADKHPSWRWDDQDRKAFCTCRKVHDIFDVVSGMTGVDFAAAKIRVAEAIRRSDLIQIPGKYQVMDAASLLSVPVENRDDRLPVAYLAHRLEVSEAEVPRPNTRMVGIKALGYFDAPAGTGDKPRLVGEFPCAVFETIDAEGQRHAHRIYLAPGGAGKADLGKRADGEERDPKKSANKADKNDRVTGRSVIWGDPAQAPHLIVAEGIETASAVALVWWADICAGAVAVVSAIDANGIEAFRPWPATKIITVAADRDEGVNEAGRPRDRRGERAARKLAMARQDRVEVRIALPGEPETKTDWLDVLLTDGADAVRAGVTHAEPFVQANAEPVEPPPNPAEPGDLAAFLSASNWLERKLEPPEPLLGEVITNTTRMFLGGPTGLGKTHVGFGMAAGMATGEGFIHWKASRASRVLYLDGEMSRDLVQERLADLRRRFGGVELSNLFVLCAEDREEIAAMCPDLGEMGPLNTADGQAFVLKLIEHLGGVDVVFFDNRMSLLSGDMKDEQPWTETMALVKELTCRRIAQIWIDHTGHDTGRIYGTKTKEWQFDVVGLMEKADRPGTDIAFSLKFEKARRRKPSNRADFEPITATLANDEWSVEGGPTGGAKRKVSMMTEAFHKALLDALVKTPTPGVATRDLWYAECVRSGLTDPINADDARATKDRKKSKLRKHMAELKAAGWIGVNGDQVRSLAVEPTEPRRTASNHAEPAEPEATDDQSRQAAEPPPAGVEPLSNPVEPVEPPPNHGGSNPAQGVEPVEPSKQGVEPLSNLAVSNLSNPVEPLSNHCRTTVEPAPGTTVEPSNPVSIDGFAGSTVRHPVRRPQTEQAPLPATLVIDEYDT